MISCTGVQFTTALKHLCTVTTQRRITLNGRLEVPLVDVDEARCWLTHNHGIH